MYTVNYRVEVIRPGAVCQCGNTGPFHRHRRKVGTR